MPRSNRPRRGGRPRGRVEDDRGGGFLAYQSTADWNGEEWSVRSVSGSTAKVYRCPGCDHEIRPGTGHVVAWRDAAGADDRRHWHTPCWAARTRRGPGRG